MSSIKTCYIYYNDESHCYISENCHGWGCRHLRGIGFETSCMTWRFWYNIGHFENNSYKKWIVDKAELKKLLLDEVLVLGVNMCPQFNISEMYGKVDSLPEEIIIDNENWTLMENTETGKIEMISHFEKLHEDLDFPDIEMPDSMIDKIDWDEMWKDFED